MEHVFAKTQTNRGGAMQLIISGKNLEVSGRLKEYVEKKIGKLDRYLPTLTEARVELALENTKNAAQSQVVQVTLRNNGTVLRGEERSSDFTAAIDAVLDKLYKQIDRYKGKRQRSRGQGERTSAEVATESEKTAPRIVRTKQFRTLPMTEEEAIEQMELLGHNFFVFFNRERGTLNVLYQRNDGNYGLIEPEMA
jgi:putative sigma-54 modulation protein